MYYPTRENLQGALLELLKERSLDDITAKMVCQRAGVSRQTLYNHYYCLMDIYQEVLLQDLETATTGCNTYLTWADGYRVILECLERHRADVLHVFRSSYREELLQTLERFGGGLVGRGIEQCAADLNLRAPDEDKEFLQNLYMHAFMGVIRHWLEKGMRLSPAYMASRCEAVMHHSIRDSLKRLEQMESVAPVDI